MADSDIQEQIDIFMKKLGKGKVPTKKASGEAIVSGKPKKVKPPKKGSLIPTFFTIGVTGFTPNNKADLNYGKLFTLVGLVEKVEIPKYASEMSPTLQLMAKVFSDTKWAAKMQAIKKEGEEAPIPLFQACVLLGAKLDEWGQSKGWDKVKKHKSSQNTFKQIIATVDKEVIDKAIKDGEEWLPKSGPPPNLEIDSIESGELEIPGGNKWVKDSMTIIASSSFNGIDVYCDEGVLTSAKILLTVDGVGVLKTNPELKKGMTFHYVPDKPILMTGKKLTVSYKSETPITVKHKIFLQYEEQPAQVTLNAEETEEQVPEESGDHEKFIEQLINIVSVLDETKVGQPPDQPIVLLKYKGEWTATLMTKEGEDIHVLTEKPQEEPLALPPGPEVLEKPEILVLTTPVKISSPGNHKQVPPTFISIPPGIVRVSQFIWTIPSEVDDSTPCKVLVGYGAEGFIMDGTFESANEALPFKLDKGGVLKVTLMTTQPIEVWLELELELQPPSGFFVNLGKMLSPSTQPEPLLAPPAPKEEPKEPVTGDEKLKMSLAEVEDAQTSLISNYEKLGTLLKDKYGINVSDAVKSLIIESQKQKVLTTEALAKLDTTDQVGNKVKQIPTSPLGSIDLKTGETVSVPEGHPALEKKGYKPGITVVNIKGQAIDAKELAEKFKSHLKTIGFTYYTIEGSDHEFKKTKGILMNKKITWAGDPELNLIKWALTNGQIYISKSKGIKIHDKNGVSVSFLDTLVWLAAGMKPKK